MYIFKYVNIYTVSFTTSQRHVVGTKIRQFTNRPILNYLGDMQELGLPEYTNNSNNKETFENQFDETKNTKYYYL